MKAQVMKLAHDLAKKHILVVINYRKAFKESLRKAWQLVKAESVKASGLAEEFVSLVLRNLGVKPSSKDYALAVEAINKVAKPEHFYVHGFHGAQYVDVKTSDFVEEAVCDILGW